MAKGPDYRAVIISGCIGSGKTALAEALSRRLGWPRSGFGDAIRDRARLHGVREPNRQTLQSIGWQWVHDDPEQLAEATLSRIGWTPGQPIILDGPRYSRLIDAIRRRIAPLRTFVVFVDTPFDVRQLRAANRPEESVDDLGKADAHEVEQEVGSELHRIADLSVDGMRRPDELAEQIVAAIKPR